MQFYYHCNLLSNGYISFYYFSNLARHKRFAHQGDDMGRIGDPSEKLSTTGERTGAANTDGVSSLVRSHKVKYGKVNSLFASMMLDSADAESALKAGATVSVASATTVESVSAVSDVSLATVVTGSSSVAPVSLLESVTTLSCSTDTLASANVSVLQYCSISIVAMDGSGAVAVNGPGAVDGSGAVDGPGCKVVDGPAYGAVDGPGHGAVDQPGAFDGPASMDGVDENDKIAAHCQVTEFVA